jgi:hypothetical protein
LLLYSCSSIVLFYFIFLNSAGQPSARIQNEFFLSSPYLTGFRVCDLSLSPSLYLSTEVTASGGFRLLFYLFYMYIRYVSLPFRSVTNSPRLYCDTHTSTPREKKPKIAVYGLCLALSIHYLVIFSLEQTVCHCTSKRHTGHIHVVVK